MHGTRQQIRRDTHDQGIPEEVFNLLEFAVPRCKNLEYVICERLDGTFHDAEEVSTFRADYARLRNLLGQANPTAPAPVPKRSAAPVWQTPPLIDQTVAEFQSAVIMTLADAASPHAAMEALRKSTGQELDPQMVEVAMLLVRKWGRRRDDLGSPPSRALPSR